MIEKREKKKLISDAFNKQRTGFCTGRSLMMCH